MIALTHVTSAALQAFGYDAASRTLAIRFGVGKVTHFADVPPDVAADFEAAESKGKAYHALIRGKFATSTVLDDEPVNDKEQSSVA